MWEKPTAQPLWGNGEVAWEAAAQRRADAEKARTAAFSSREQAPVRDPCLGMALSAETRGERANLLS